MTPLIPMLWAWRRAIVLTLIASVLIFAGFTVNRWHASHVRLPSVQAELKAEQACEPSTACQRRAEAWAAQAKLDAEKAAQEAAGKAQAAEAKAKADAAAWRQKYRQAVSTDPDCAAWASAPIRCPVQ